VTSYKQAEVELADSRNFVEHVLDATPDFVVIHDRLAGRDVRLNNRLQDILGRSRYAGEPATHDDFYAQFHPEDLHHFLEAQEQLNRAVDGEIVETELRMRHADQSWRWVLMRQIVFRRDSTGAPQHVLALLHDITARKTAEEELRLLNADLEWRVEQRTQELNTANAALEQAAHAKDEFLANISHELRTPLTAILSFSEVLQQALYGPLSDRQKRAAELIQTSAVRLLDLINAVLDMSKSESGSLSVDLKLVRVDDVCRTAISSVADAAAAKRQHIEYEIAPLTMLTRADSYRLVQALANLLNNAVKFSPPGTEMGLRAEGKPAQQLIEISVWDKGTGIAPELQPRLFQPFTQLDGGLARRYEGAGLGLALAQRLVQLQGGSLSVHSTPGEGSCFTVTLPWVEE
jgi:PAS domain S-box-containing protein